jgi:hypothetical protein
VTATQASSRSRAQPLVAVVSSVPLVFEALRDALSAFAEVQSFPSRSRAASLLRSIRPAAVIVDADEDLSDAETVAREQDFSLVHLELAHHRVRVFRDGKWNVAANGKEVSPEIVRDLVAAGIFARGNT